ncbi:sensor histidine kinase [Nocardiopsis lucentensis]|uniref:sensor histidine kinase n=1 Tax=Nocardiopsis lucentensis TaxID=53441 RepID=UPI000348720D|nr:histidine kinase [Nocardiopsis lucentensis]
MTNDDGPVRWVPGSPFAAAALVDDTLDRVGLRGERRRDVALAVALTAVSIGLVGFLLASLEYLEGVVVPTGTWISLAAVLVAQSLTVCARRRHPVACLLGATVFQVTMVALLPAEVGLQGPALFVAAYTCGTRLRPGRLAAVVVAATLLHWAAGSLVIGRLAPEITLPLISESPLTASLGLLLAGLPVFVIPALVGAYVGTRRRYVDLLRIRADEEARAQRERLEAAIRAERAGMARELHDIAAHHLSGMVVQAGAAERLVGRDDEAARKAMAWVRAQGKETLASLRLVVGALRDPDEESGGLHHRGEPGARGAPVPGLAALDRLVAAERDLGADIDLVREGEAHDLPPIADVTAYRVVQESLSNARDHAAGARVRLLVRHESGRVVLDIENGAGGARATAREHRGLGVLGMRERAQVVGAALEVGPTGPGGWRVRWEIPVERRGER